jgi:hypothetical protein
MSVASEAIAAAATLPAKLVPYVPYIPPESFLTFWIVLGAAGVLFMGCVAFERHFPSVFSRSAGCAPSRLPSRALTRVRAASSSCTSRPPPTPTATC